MAHKQQVDFCLKVKKKFPRKFKNCKVLDVGSFDCNGNNRFLFDIPCNFTGIDIGPGPGVDIVCPAQDYGAPDNFFDVIISTECFEHNPYLNETVKNIVRMLKSGGLFLFTCATTGRPIHGVASLEEDCAFQHDSWTTLPNVSAESWDNEYYKNVREEDLRECVDIDGAFVNYAFSIDHDHCDLYFWGIKR